MNIYEKFHRNPSRTLGAISGELKVVRNVLVLVLLARSTPDFGHFQSAIKKVLDKISTRSFLQRGELP